MVPPELAGLAAGDSGCQRAVIRQNGAGRELGSTYARDNVKLPL
jgi:hypothetical protein